MSGYQSKKLLTNRGRRSMAIFQHDPECSQECCEAMVGIFSPHYDVKIFDESQFNFSTLNGVDVVAFGGGIGDADKYYDFFKRREGNIIAEYVASGGCYLGICMGAYWAGRNYFDLLADLEPVQYIKRPDSDIRRSYSTIADVFWYGGIRQMFFYDGCAFEGVGIAEVVARYVNGDPMAIIQGNVGLIGCHPESQQNWYDKKYLAKHWHNGEHHKLLLDFVAKLVEGANQ